MERKKMWLDEWAAAGAPHELRAVIMKVRMGQENEGLMTKVRVLVDVSTLCICRLRKRKAKRARR